jgi:hypothetical protein
MAKFSVNFWVRPDDGTNLGIVRGHKSGKTNVRWIGAKRAIPWPTSKLRAAKEPAALVLEGSLDSDLSSLRSEEDLLRNWFRALGLRMSYKTVHCIEDIP